MLYLQKKSRRFWKPWELALLLALCAGALAGTWASRVQGELSGQLIRLHVLAVDDSAAEQAVKLEVRDAVLAYLEPRLADSPGKDQAQQALERELNGVQAAAQAAAGGRAVTVTLGQEYYPTRRYDGFSLPAGEYTSLRVTLGAGAGRNWWCVVYPPLCITAAQASSQAMETLTPGTARIIAEEDGYVIQFKILELWGELTENFRENGAN